MGRQKSADGIVGPSICLRLQWHGRRAVPVRCHILQFTLHAFRSQPAVARTSEHVEELLEVFVGPGRAALVSECELDFFLTRFATLRERNRVCL